MLVQLLDLALRWGAGTAVFAVLIFVGISLPEVKRQAFGGAAFAGSVLAAGYFVNGVGRYEIGGIPLSFILIAAAAGGPVVAWVLIAQSPVKIGSPTAIAPLYACALFIFALLAPQLVNGRAFSPALWLLPIQMLLARSRRIDPLPFGKGIWIGTGLTLALGVIFELALRPVSQSDEKTGNLDQYGALLSIVGIEYRMGNTLGGPAPFAFVAAVWAIAGWRYLPASGRVIAALMATGVVLATAARSGLLILVLALGVLSLLRRRAGSQKVRAVVGLFASVAGLWLLYSTLNGEQRGGISTATGRLPLWTWTVNMLLDEGWAWGRGAWPESPTLAGAPWDAVHAHSMYLMAWWTVGLAGLALVALLFWSLLHDGRHLAGFERVQYVVLVTSLAVYVVQEPGLLYAPTAAAAVWAVILMAVQSKPSSLTPASGAPRIGERLAHVPAEHLRSLAGVGRAQACPRCDRSFAQGREKRTCICAVIDRRSVVEVSGGVIALVLEG